jgi:hypothetical protein
MRRNEWSPSPECAEPDDGASRDTFERRWKHDEANSGRRGVALGTSRHCGASTASGRVVRDPALMTCRASTIGGGAGPAGPR